MRLCLGPRTYDLTPRALVMGAVERAGCVAEAVRDGADIVEVAHVDGSLTVAVPVCLAVSAQRGLEEAIAAGASLVWFDGGASTAAYEVCRQAGASIVVAAAEAGSAERAGIPPDRIVVVEGGTDGRFPVLADVTRAPSPTAATAAAVVGGARIVRTAQIRRARRICDVLAAVMEAGTGR